MHTLPSLHVLDDSGVTLLLNQVDFCPTSNKKIYCLHIIMASTLPIIICGPYGSILNIRSTFHLTRRKDQWVVDVITMAGLLAPIAKFHSMRNIPSWRPWAPGNITLPPHPAEALVQWTFDMVKNSNSSLRHSDCLQYLKQETAFLLLWRHFGGSINKLI